MRNTSFSNHLRLRAVNSSDADTLYAKAYSNELFKLNSSHDKQQIKKVLLERENYEIVGTEYLNLENAVDFVARSN